MKLKSIIAIAAMAFASTSAYAQQSYLGFGAGLQFDLGQLTNTIVLDGLNSGVGAASLYNASALTGCASSVDPQACQTENPGDAQKLIVSENELDSLDKSTGGSLFDNDLNGGMTGIQLNVFWESEGQNTFWRVGLMYTTKLTGGNTESRVLGFKWLHQQWDYKAWQIPFYYGFKTGIGESASVYAGAGLHYFNGGWDVGGTVYGDIPTYVLGTAVGPHTVLDSNTGTATGGSIVNEAIKYRVNGWGFNFLIGIERKLENGNKVFFEIDRAYSGGMANDRTKTAGGSNGLAPFASYPIAIGGTSYRFGYKMAM